MLGWDAVTHSKSWTWSGDEEVVCVRRFAARVNNKEESWSEYGAVVFYAL